MSFNLSGPEAIFVGLDGLNLNTKSWQVQFDGAKATFDLVDYGHGASGPCPWLRFTVAQNQVDVVWQATWDLSTGDQQIETGPTASSLTLQTQKATVKGSQTDFIVPGIDALGTHVWLRYQDQASNQPKQARFQTPLHVNLGNTAAIIKLLGIVGI